MMSPSNPVQNYGPFVIRAAMGQEPEWFCIVGGRTFGPWPDKGACEAGYQTELRRALRRKPKKDDD